MAKTPLKLYSLEEMQDRYIGKNGTPAREDYEHELRMDILGYTIKKARQQRKLTQEQLGKLVGVQKAQISKLEGSVNSASIATLSKVFKALDAEIYFTVKLKDQKPVKKKPIPSLNPGAGNIRRTLLLKKAVRPEGLPPQNDNLRV